MITRTWKIRRFNNRIMEFGRVIVDGVTSLHIRGYPIKTTPKELPIWDVLGLKEVTENGN